jgi:hypothetical protein
MISRKEDRIEHLGTTILFVLCFFLLAAFHQNSNNPVVTGAFQYQIATLHTFAVSSKEIPQLSSLQGFVSLFDEMNFKRFNEQLRLLTDNRLINQRIVLLRKVELLIKPVILQEFYYHHLLLCSEDLPVLS